MSKEQFNEGSTLQDELLGTEGGVYSTFFRTYDPATGRFTGVDPLADATPDWNPYQFALGNPIAANDPTGALSQGEIQFLYNMLDLVNGSDNISGISLSFGGSGGGGDAGFGSFISGVAGSTVSHIGYENGQLTWGGVNYLGDGNGNPLPNTGVSWSYSLSVGVGGSYPVGLRQFLAIVVGEAKNSPDAATGIGSTLINRMILNHVTLNDSDWAVKSLMPNERAKDAKKQQASGAYQILRSKNADVTSIMDERNSVGRMVNGSNPTIRAAYLAYTNWGVKDFSNGALYWNATAQKYDPRGNIGVNFEYLKAGIYIQTAELGNTTFFAPKPNRHR